MANTKVPSKRWNPYLAGALTGILMVLSVWIAGKYFGASTSYARTAGMIEQTVTPEHVQATDYFQKYAVKDTGLLAIDWQMLFVLGILLGALVAAVASGTFRWQGVPDMWREKFGPSGPKRHVVAFFGGFIALFGARMAGGCPSGHGLSGLMQLSLSGYVALIAFFVGGVITARLLYGSGKPSVGR